MIGSRRDHRRLLGGIRCVVIDELHAFAGDDRGWHVLALLERIRALSGSEMQRIGLSATVGHPASLLEWMAGHCKGERRLVSISAPPAGIDLIIDFVGCLDNAATVISQLHRGEKRLVFCDSRSRVEDLAQGLRTRGVDTFVSHAALAADTRRQAEQAFSERQNCVIVATSTLELGLDVGDLDRVIQIDAPQTVASFLQRLGRTGRREGVKRNTLFLATTDVALLECAALASLFQAGYVEPVVAPADPYHIMVQQLLASILQSNNELGERDFAAVFLRVPEFARLLVRDWKDVLEHLAHEGWIVRDGGQLSLGPRGDARFRGRGLADLCVSFESPRSVSVFLGNKHLGGVDPLSLVSSSDAPKVISLGGRAWRVAQIEWSQQRVYVEPSEGRGRTRWIGNSRGVSSPVAHEVMRVVGEPAKVKDYLTRRADGRLNALSGDLQWTLGGEPIKSSDGDWIWWTFAGFRENQLLAAKIESIGGRRRALDGYSIRFELNKEVALAHNDWDGVKQIHVEHLNLPLIHFKFDELLPERTRYNMVAIRSGAPLLLR